MARIRPIFLSLPLFLLISITSAAPSRIRLDKASFNTSVDPLLHGRSLEKREVFFHCSNAGFSGLLAQAIQDASTIMSNMVAHLDLAISLYKEDGSGELKVDKATKALRSFDEQNAFVSYTMFITRHYWGPGDARNQLGLQQLKGTRDLARNMQSQYAAYVAGRSVIWTRNGYPYVNIYCNDADVYSETNKAGLTYTEEVTTRVNPSLSADGSTLVYWVSQSKGVQNGGERWVPRLAVCALQEGAGQTRFGIVPADAGIKAYVHPADYGLIEETMVFCPVKFDNWISLESKRTASGLHYRNLHVDIGSSSTAAQKSASASLLAAADFTSSPPRATRWLSDFLVMTMLHESTHAEAFTGQGNKLIDVRCMMGDEVMQTSTDPGCMAQIARGTKGLDRWDNPQGHKDAEAFAMYAMATWVNTVYWYKGYMPKDRDTYQN